MLSLEQQQLSLQALIAQRPIEMSDPWLQSVAGSPGLRQIHRITSWWQRFQLEAQCRYTTRLMKRLGCFDSLIDEHFRAHPTPPSIEELTGQFLSSLMQANDPLLASVAEFELACLTQADRPAARHTILWDRNPNLVFAALEGFVPLPSAEPGVSYTLSMDPSLPNKLCCLRLPTE